MLKKPLTRRAIVDSFASLGVTAPGVDVFSRGADAVVDGAWSRVVLARTFRALGYAQADGGGFAFVNESRTVGLVLQGVEIDHKANRFRKFNFEIQARTASEARAQDSNPNPRLF